MIEAAATKIMIPSSAAEKYSALLWPKWWSSSAGRAAMVSETRATMAATRLTIDSAASESRPTDPVMAQAPPLSSTISMAVAIASQAYFLRSGAGAVGRPVFSIRLLCPASRRRRCRFVEAPPQRVGQAGAGEFAHVGVDQPAFGVEEQGRRQAAGAGVEHRARMRVEQDVVELEAGGIE